MILDYFFSTFSENYSRRVCKSTNKKFWLYRTVDQLRPLSSNLGSGESVQKQRLDAAFAPHIHKVWIQMKTQTKILVL